MFKEFNTLTLEELNRINDENLFDYIKVFCQAEVVEFNDNDECLSVVNNINGISMITNCVNRANFSASDVDGCIDRVLNKFRSRGLPLMWTVGPITKPENLGKYLLKKGMMHVDTYTKMAIALDSLNREHRLSDDFEIFEVTEKSLLDKWFNIYSVSFDLSWLIEAAHKKFYAGLFLDSGIPAKTYIGLWKGHPVATSQVFFNNECAGIYNIDTLPEARNRGLGYMMTLKALLKAKEEGYKTATLQATKKGYPIYKKLGFIDTGHSDCYIKMHGVSMVAIPVSFIARIAINKFRSIFKTP
ncbi:MAG: GNAT family N-acetyltransferase [Bacteroidota bacterium]